MIEPQGYLALVLHAHLPFVRHPEHDTFLEEDWLFEAITETYLPLLETFTRLHSAGSEFRITMSFTPTLCEMLTDPLLNERYYKGLQSLRALVDREVERTEDRKELQRTALMYRERLEAIDKLYTDVCKGDIIGEYRKLQDAGCLEIVTCAATHAFLPFLTPDSVRAQLRVAVTNYEKHFGRPPAGMWLPECAYCERLDADLKSVGLKYFFLESHGVIFARPRPRNSVFAPVETPGGLAAFGRDIESSQQVWSSTSGYPGDGDYREFYRDLGYDAPEEYIKPFLHEDGVRRNLGIKYHRITGRDVALEHKDYYNPADAERKTEEHAGNFLFNRKCQAEFLKQALKQTPLIVSPYDAELFGHWWYEGPQFIDHLLRRIVNDQSDIKLITPSEYLAGHTSLQKVTPAASSWGDKGYYEVWLNGSNDWIYPLLYKAEMKMSALARDFIEPTEQEHRALNQAARELMLAQASDWAFIMTSGTMVDYARKRTSDHMERFDRLHDELRAGTLSEEFLAEVEHRDNIFAEMDYSVYRC